MRFQETVDQVSLDLDVSQYQAWLILKKDFDGWSYCRWTQAAGTHLPNFFFFFAVLVMLDWEAKCCLSWRDQ